MIITKKCCKRNKKFFGKHRVYHKCPICKHIYCDEYPEFTLRCKCEKMPLKKAITKYDKI